LHGAGCGLFPIKQPGFASQRTGQGRAFVFNFDKWGFALLEICGERLQCGLEAVNLSR
jgi:hypothetical protein